MKQLSLDLNITFHPPVEVLPPDPYWDEMTKQDNVLEQDKLDTSEAQNPNNCVLEQVNIATAPEQLNHVAKSAPGAFHQSVLEQDKLDTSEAQNPTNCVLEQVNIATAPEHSDHVEKLAPEHFHHFALKEFDHPKKSAPEHNHWVEKYSPSNRPGNFYYRYVWRKGGKLHHMHIRGGHVGKPRAIEMKDKVLSAIAQGEHPEKIVRLIRNGRI